MQNSRFSGLAKKAGIFSIGKIRGGHFEIPGFGLDFVDLSKKIQIQEKSQVNPSWIIPRKNRKFPAESERGEFEENPGPSPGLAFLDFF